MVEATYPAFSQNADAASNSEISNLMNRASAQSWEHAWHRRKVAEVTVSHAEKRDDGDLDGGDEIAHCRTYGEASKMLQDPRAKSTQHDRRQ
jgi:hypothetical protein